MNCKKFKLGDLFELKTIKQAKSQSLIPEDPNGIPYIVQSTQNNMFKTMVNEQWLIDNNEPPIEGNVIVLGVTLPAVSYQPSKFGASQVIVAKADFLNEYVALYFVAILRKHIQKFSYQQKPGVELYKNLELELPTKDGKTPDYSYMEEYMKNQQESLRTSINNFLIDYNKKNNNNEDKTIIKHKEFKVSDLFTVEGTKSLDAGGLKFVEEGINFVGRTGENNGIQGKIEKQSFEPNEADTITVTVIGNYKYVKLQKEPYYCSQNINKLTPKQKGLSDYSLYYLMAYIQKFVSAYNGQQGGYKLDDLKNTKLLLPVTEAETPDYDYMKQYMRNQEIKIVKEINDFYKKELSKDEAQKA